MAKRIADMDWLTTKEIADRFRCSARSVRRYIGRADFPIDGLLCLPGRDCRINPDVFGSWLRGLAVLYRTADAVMS